MSELAIGINYAALVLALVALAFRFRASTTKMVVKATAYWYGAVVFWLVSSFFIYAQSLAIPLEWYFQNNWIRAKLAIGLTILGLELKPLLLFSKKTELTPPQKQTLARISVIELILTALLTIISITRTFNLH